MRQNPYAAALTGWMSIAAMGLLLPVNSTRPTNAAQTAGPLAINWSRFQLPNGLDVVFAPDDSATEVSIEWWGRAVARQEAPGRFGLAHFFEHATPWGQGVLRTKLGRRLFDSVLSDGNASCSRMGLGGERAALVAGPHTRPTTDSEPAPLSRAATADTEFRDLAGRLGITATFSRQTDRPAIETWLRRELARVLADDVTERELELAREVEIIEVREKLTRLGWQNTRSELLGEGVIFADDPGSYLRRLARQADVTPDDARRCALKWLGRPGFTLFARSTQANDGRPNDRLSEKTSTQTAERNEVVLTAGPVNSSRPNQPGSAGTVDASARMRKLVGLIALRRRQEMLFL